MAPLSFPPGESKGIYLARGAAFGTAIGAAIAASTTRHVPITGAAAATATIGQVQVKITRAGTIRSWEARAVAGAGTGDLTARITINGSATGDTLTWTAGAAEASKTTDTDIAVAAGDLVAIQFVNANTVNDGTFYGARVELA